MADAPGNTLPHLILVDTAVAEAFTPRGGGPRLDIAPRNRAGHAERLIGQFEGLRTDFDAIREERMQHGFDIRDGLQLEFESLPDFELKFESLDLRREGIELLSLSRRDGKMIAVCFVPDGKLDYFIKKIEEYRDKTTPKGKPRNQPLIANIENVRLAAVDALWTDNRARLPGNDDPFWWEIWLRRDDAEALAALENAAEIAGFSLSAERLAFPERVVVTARATKLQLSQSMKLVGVIAELREAKKTAAEFIDLPTTKQYELTEALQKRLTIAAEGPAVCLLDTGATRAHPLLSDSLSEADCQAYKEEWDGADDAGHGTSMAGLALFGNLIDVFAEDGPIALESRLESVKIIDEDDCLEASIEDPGQSWNPLTVGACTQLVTLPAADFPGWSVVAQAGDVSPFSCFGDMAKTLAHQAGNRSGGRQLRLRSRDGPSERPGRLEFAYDLSQAC